VKEQWAKLRDWFEKLAPRERKLVAALGVVLSIAVILAVPVTISLAAASRAEENAKFAEAIHKVKNARNDVDRRKAKREAILARYVNRPPALAGFIEKAARDNKLDIIESNDRTEVPHGKKYVERTTVVRLRKVPMLSLARMLEQIEQQRMPIAISRIGLRRRGGELDSYDIELAVSAYDRTDAIKESKDTKEPKEPKETKESKETRDLKPVTGSIGGPK
jgi:general secretion pathway protein M